MEEGLAPSITEAAEQPLDVALAILDLRAYARVKAAVDGAEKMSDISPQVKASPYYARVVAVTAATAREHLASQRTRRGERAQPDVYSPGGARQAQEKNQAG